jgi:hypothetical protein
MSQAPIKKFEDSNCAFCLEPHCSGIIQISCILASILEELKRIAKETREPDRWDKGLTDKAYQEIYDICAELIDETTKLRQENALLRTELEARRAERWTQQ